MTLALKYNPFGYFFFYLLFSGEGKNAKNKRETKRGGEGFEI